MYIFSRRVQIATATVRDGMAWAVGQVERVSSISGLQLNLWGDVFGQQVGSLVFGTIIPDLATLEAATDKLQRSEDYLTSIQKGASYTTGPARDTLLQVAHGTPDPNREVGYVSVVSAMVADGSYGRAAAVGIEIAERAAKITGLAGVFGFDVTGPYGGVRWLTPTANIAEFEAANQALGTDASFTEYLDHDAKGVFISAPGATMQTLLRRIV